MSKKFLKELAELNRETAECLHPESAKQDMERVVGFFNDLRDNPVPKWR